MANFETIEGGDKDKPLNKYQQRLQEDVEDALARLRMGIIEHGAQQRELAHQTGIAAVAARRDEVPVDPVQREIGRIVPSGGPVVMIHRTFGQ